MTDNITNELIYEVLKSLQDGQAKILTRITSMESEVLSMRKQIHNVQGDSIRRDGIIAELSLNIDRINTRLNLTDA